MNPNLLSYYEAIEQASADMVAAAKAGNWSQVARLEGTCVLLISQLKHAARDAILPPDQLKPKSRIMHRILLNDAQVRTLAEPWRAVLDRLLAGRQTTMHLH